MNLCCLLTLCVIYCATAEDLPKVTTPNGVIQGTYDVSYEGLKFSQFLGVPYAKPPIGDLRFKEPQPLEKWSGIWNANFTIHCLQINHAPEPEGGTLIGQEDCLYLNIYVPSENSLTEKLDVIVHIHGGALNFGNARCYAGAKYLMDANVVLVTINYRLGPLGFLSTEDEVVPGNNGMKDQSASLKWIQENIKYFGGNRHSVTITGLSAGGASVHFHYLSPLSKGLFHKGISVSGTALCPWTMQKNALEKTRMLSAAVGCTQTSTEDLINCLKERPAEQIVENVRMFRPWLFNPFTVFGIVVEKDAENPFLYEHPYVLLSEGKVHDLPWINSVTSEEGLYPAADYVVQQHYLSDLDRRWEELASAVLDYNFSLPVELHSSIAKQIKEYYLKGNSISPGTFDELVQMVGDRHFVVPAEKAARMQAKINKSPVFFYYFSYMSENLVSLADLWSHSEDRYGVAHGDDIIFILSSFTHPIKKMTTRDEDMKDILLDMWESFAETGVPQVDDVDWKEVTEEDDDLDYLHIESPESINMKSTKDLGHNEFWKTIPFKEGEELIQVVKDEL